MVGQGRFVVYDGSLDNNLSPFVNHSIFLMSNGTDGLAVMLYVLPVLALGSSFIIHLRVR